MAKAYRLLGGLILWHACATVAHGATTTYTTAWGGGVIAPDDTVVIGNGGSVTGNVTANGTLQFNHTTALSMGGTISGTGSLMLTNTGTLTLTGYSSGTAALDLAIGASGGQLMIGTSGSGSLGLGTSGTGSLTVAGGQVTNFNAFLGLAAGGTGLATVTGGTWQCSRPLHVGFNGAGTLSLAGGRVTATNGSIGSNLGSVGVATISAGTWANNSQFSVGGYSTGTGGAGTLVMTGGQLTANTSVVGWNGGVGAATVSGGTWSSSVVLHVGRSGSGTLTITGGQVTSASGTIGTSVNGFGSAAITGGTWSNAGSLAVGGAGTGTLTISGSGSTGGVVIVGGTLSCGASGTITLGPGGTLQIGTGTTASGGLATDRLENNGSLVFSRTGSGTIATAISGSGSLAVAGSGTLTFSGSNSFTGPTSVDAGALSVTGAFGSSAVSVGPGGRLLGSGTIGGPVTVNANGVLSPGVGIESLATGAVTLHDASAFIFEFNSSAPSSVAADLVAASGAISLTGTVSLSLVDLATSPSAFAPGTTLSLMSYTGGWNGGVFAVDGSALADGASFFSGGQWWTIDYDASAGGSNFAGDFLSGSFVNLTAVPEPSAVVLALAGLAAGGWRIRRRWSAPT